MGVLGIKWIPSREKAEVGQLILRVQSVVFDSSRIEAPQWKNPWITVCTYDESRHPQQIRRWDPRTAIAKVANIATVGVAFDGAFKDHIGFPSTMMTDMFGMLHYKWGHGGWEADELAWKWSQKWGEQRSVENFAMRRDFCASSTASKYIHLKACRIITQQILNTSVHPVSNRQAALISDAVFSRAGVVPGLTDAILVPGDTISTDYKNIKELRAEYDLTSRSYADVMPQLVHELESQVTKNLGQLDVQPHETGERQNLTDLRITDPFQGQEKVLWIRYLLAGTGERVNVRRTVTVDGYLDKPLQLQYDLDREREHEVARNQMCLSREEFVGCVLASPLLGESLRQLSTSDTSSQDVPKGSPLMLEVVLADPNKTADDDDFFDIMNVRRSVLLEVWDHDQGSRHDFLGECWLPSLATLGSTGGTRSFVLPLKGASLDGTTRPHPQKNIKAECTGTLHVTAWWQLPAETLKEPTEDASRAERAKYQEGIHTGRFQIKIVKAENLRAADVRRKNGSDPYVSVHVHNDAYSKAGEGWKKNMAGIHEHVFQTSVKKKTLNPVWDEMSEPIFLKTGAFEKRTHQAPSVAVTGRQSVAKEDKRTAAILSDSAEELRIFFGDRNKSAQEGGRHNVQVFSSDTIHEFKNKVTLACADEARAERDPVRRATYANLKLGYGDVVTVFVPSPTLQNLSIKGHANSEFNRHEYNRLMKVEPQDPSRWQPLNPTCVFNQYSKEYGFGSSRSVRLRVHEASEEYRTLNPRYRRFEAEQASKVSRIETLNEKGRCFGYAKYTHDDDGGSLEWRPAIISSLDQEDSAGEQLYKASWLYAPRIRYHDDSIVEESADIITEDQTLIGPLSPQILRAYEEFLAQALSLQETGMSEGEIATELNARLMRKYGAPKEAKNESSAASLPQRQITVAQVKNYLRQQARLRST